MTLDENVVTDREQEQAIRDLLSLLDPPERRSPLSLKQGLSIRKRRSLLFLWYQQVRMSSVNKPAER